MKTRTFVHCTGHIIIIMFEQRSVSLQSIIFDLTSEHQLYVTCVGNYPWLHWGLRVWCWVLPCWEWLWNCECQLVKCLDCLRLLYIIIISRWRRRINKFGTQIFVLHFPIRKLIDFKLILHFPKKKYIYMGVLLTNLFLLIDSAYATANFIKYLTSRCSHP